jgi:allantoinase
MGSRLIVHAEDSAVIDPRRRSPRVGHARRALRELPRDGDFGTAWGGSASLQVGLPAVWSGARVRGTRSPRSSSGWRSGPRGWRGWRTRGRSPSAGTRTSASSRRTRRSSSTCTGSAHRNPVSPYDGRALSGVVRRTWLRGARIDVSGPPAGRLLRRGAR